MTVVLLEHIHPDGVARLEAVADRVVHLEDPDEVAAFAAREPVHVFITRGREEVRRPLIEACPDLRVIARVGVGVDNIDVDVAAAHGVPVVNAPGSTTVAVAEHTLLLAMALLRKLPALAEAARDGRWEIRRGYTGGELADLTIGIVGMGEIGRRVARLAEAFDMRVVYWSRTAKEVAYPRRALPDLLAEADVVSLHLALTPDTRGLIDAVALARMKPTAVLVNTARGAVIDQQALLEALDAGRPAGFAADVLADEPPPADEPLLVHPRALLTPHVAAMTGNTFRKMTLRTVENVVAVLEGRSPALECVVNAAALAAR